MALPLLVILDFRALVTFTTWIDFTAVGRKRRQICGIQFLLILCYKEIQTYCFKEYLEIQCDAIIIHCGSNEY